LAGVVTEILPSDFRFDPVREEDLPMLREWLMRPHVAEWWGPADSIDDLRDDYVAAAEGPKATRAFIARFRSRPIGFIQSYVVAGSGGGWWKEETDPGARGTDQFLSEESDLGRGLGSAMLRAFLDLLFLDAQVTAVQTDPDPRNERAIRCFRRAGFRPVQEVRTPDGPALLMRLHRPGATPEATAAE
jgi:RimJ/RimL family protein N-acetyltransferase